MKMSPYGHQVLVDREGFSLTAYQDSVGVWTIGCGHAATSNVPPIPHEGMTITPQQAWLIFDRDTDAYEEGVTAFLKVMVTNYEFDACVSFAFNVGLTAFETSTFLERLNNGDRTGALEALLWWDQPPEIIPRRQGEYVEFRDGIYLARVDPIPPPVAA